MKKRFSIELQFDPERTGWTSVTTFAAELNTLLEGKGLQTEVVEDSRDDKLVIIDFVDKFEPELKPQSLQKAFNNMTKATSNGK